MSRSLFARLARRYGPPVDLQARREFLKLTLASSAGLLISQAPAWALPRRVSRDAKRILIIGAGFSGLASAYELKSAGYDVRVVEARSRLGGRVLSFPDFVPGKNVEGGGEYIGSNHPTWVAYKEKFNLEFLDVSEDESADSPIVIAGKRLDNEEASKLYEEMEEALKKMDADAAPIDADEPWKAENAKALDARATKAWIEALEVSALCRAAVTIELTANNGQSVDRQSYLGNLTQVKGGGLEKYWTESEVYRCKGGNQQLAKMLAESVGPDRILLQTPVLSVDTSKPVVKVRCAGGQSFECDDVVLAVPPSVWAKIDFSPRLPGALDPQMGTNLKYITAVKNRFWKAKKLSPDSLGDGDVSMTWDATDGQNEGEDGGEACLAVFSGGPAAKRCRERDPEARKAHFAEELEVLYPGYKEAAGATRFMDWPGDPWTQSGYSFPAPGQVTTIGPQLRAGIPPLHFAGEHACYKFVGYMEGALNAGAALAKRLAERDGMVPAQK